MTDTEVKKPAAVKTFEAKGEAKTVTIEHTGERPDKAVTFKFGRHGSGA